MMNIFGLFDFNGNDKYFSDKETVKKRALKIFGIFFIIAIAMSSFTLLGFLFFFLLLFSLGGIFLVEYYSDELDKKYGLYNFNNFRGYSRQIGAFTLLGFSTTALALLLICLCADINVYTSILLSIIFSLPFLAIGLRFKTFNDASLEENGKIVYDAGYEPNYYCPVLAICCYLGYVQGFFETSSTNIIALIISSSFCFIWLVFPDKINKYIPFENRNKKGEAIYLAIALIIFFILFSQFTTVPFVKLMGFVD
ncbi:hypothetical protein [Methanobrevibacter sp.]|uniref:hypothetical protein n=1 Tax=Methanobrevibacter sp. TaxID=66852 RepID=UPI00388F5F9A